MSELLSLTVPVPSIRGKFGKQLQTFQTSIRAGDVQHLLGHDPRSKHWARLPEDLKEMYHYLQRKTSKGRREGAARYIRERFGPNAYTIGAFPAIAIGVTKAPRFEPFSDKTIPAAVGILHFDLSASIRRILLDGLSRVTGAMDVLEADPKLADCFTFPVTIYAPIDADTELTVEQLGQLFHDFNFLAEPVSKGQAIDLDQSDIYIALTNRLADTPVIKRNGGVEPRAASLGKKSTALVAKQVLLRFVKGACEGAGLQHALRLRPDEPGNLTVNTLPQIQDRLEHYITVMSEEMGPRFRERDSIHLTAPGWNALGIVFYDLQFKAELSPGEQETILKKIGQIDWSRWNPDWLDFLGNPELDENGKEVTDGRGRKRLGKSRGGGEIILKIAEYVRQKSGLAVRLVTQVS